MLVTGICILILSGLLLTLFLQSEMKDLIFDKEQANKKAHEFEAVSIMGRLKIK